MENPPTKMEPAASAQDAKPHKRKLTKEEKKAKRLEKKRLKGLKKIEKEKQLIRDRLNREVKYSKKNYEKVKRHWLEFMNRLKSAELKKNLDETWAEFQYLSDWKDNYIQMMIDNRTELEEKFQWDGEKHLELINYLMSICNSLAKSLTTVFETEINHMLSEYRNEEYRQHVSAQRKTYIENIFHATTTHAIDAMTRSRNKFLEDENELAIAHIVKRDALRDSIVGNMNRVYQQMLSLYEDVKSNSQTTDRVKVYKELMEQERMHRENITIIQKKSDSLEKEIVQLKDELQTLLAEHKKVLNKMSDEKHDLSDKFRNVTVDFELKLKEDKEMLKFLVVESEKTLTDLRSLLKKGKNIFDISQLCKKYKTENETIQPWDDRTFKTDKEVKDALSDHNLKHLSKMDLFWYRTSVVQTANRELTEEKIELQKENENLQQLVRSYFQQQQYKSDVESLNINKFVTAIIPTQEAAQMFKRKRNE
ncbi:interaptin-like [Bradysia coprophila]|uniref:interaptin-like n=1 Tax=Bradysia coprophila TaxID=38358 RepID=UPI00187DC674|nr:interaptin-like [Bradysia coprophila]